MVSCGRGRPQSSLTADTFAVRGGVLSGGPEKKGEGVREGRHVDLLSGLAPHVVLPKIDASSCCANDMNGIVSW